MAALPRNAINCLEVYIRSLQNDIRIDCKIDIRVPPVLDDALSNLVS